MMGEGVAGVGEGCWTLYLLGWVIFQVFELNQ